MTFKSLRFFFSAPVFPDEETNNRAGLLSFLINLHILIGISTSILLLLFTDIRPILPLAAFISALPGIGLRALMHKGHIDLTSTLFVGMLFSLMPMVAWASGNSVASVSVTVFQAITIIMAGLLMGGRGAAAFVFLTGLTNGVLIYAELMFHYVSDTSRDPIAIWFMQVIAFGAIAAMLTVANRLIRDSFARARNSEQRYRGLLENIPAITYVIEVGHEPMNRATYVSPQIEMVTGFTSLEFINDPLLWARIIHSADRARVMAESERADHMGETFTSEYRIVTKTERTYWFHDESTLVKNEQGQPLYRLGVWTDITERKQVEIARQHSEDLYRRAIMAAGAVPYVLDHATHTLSFIGEGILSMTGYTAAEMMRPGLWNTLVEKGFPRGNLAHLTYEEADRLTEENNAIPWECDFRIRTRAGEIRWIADTSVKSYDEKSQHIVSIGIKQDITARKEAEEKIRRLNETLEARVIARTAQLEAANKELESFSYSVSHDLRAPLRAMTSFSAIIKNDFATGLDPQAMHFLNRVIESGEKMNQLIDGLLNFSRLNRKALTTQSVDVNSLVQTAIESFAPETARRQIEWIIAELPPAQADPILLQQVFTNLIGNAIKYTGQRNLARIEIGSTQQAEQTVYFVRDNGAGFEMQYADKLFGVFQRLHREDEFQGTGIGLATVQRIISRHGGRIWAEAAPDQGATFYFTLV